MPKKDTLDYCEKHLFSDVQKMQKDNVPGAIINRIVRIRSVFYAPVRLHIRAAERYCK